MGISYEVITRELDTDALAFQPGTPIQIVPRGRPIQSLTVLAIDPITEVVRLHFGTNKDAWPVEQSNAFQDPDASYDNGVWYSVPAGSAPAAGATVQFAVVYRGEN